MCAQVVAAQEMYVGMRSIILFVRRPPHGHLHSVSARVSDGDEQSSIDTEVHGALKHDHVASTVAQSGRNTEARPWMRRSIKNMRDNSCCPLMGTCRPGWISCVTQTWP